MIKIQNFIVKIDDFDLLTTDIIDVEEKDTALIFGKNNTGKSLFLRSLHKTYFKNNGNFEISANGFFKKKKKTSILIDNSINLLLDKSIYKNIILPISKLDDKKKEMISDLCNIVGLGEIYNTKCSLLSYSQAKMVEVIRAMMIDPVAIFIDDIDNFFDEINMNLFFELVEKRNAKFSVIATSKKRLERFKYLYRIQENRVVKL